MGTSLRSTGRPQIRGRIRRVAPSSPRPAPTGEPPPEVIHDRTAAEILAPTVETLVGEPPVPIELWDGSSLGPADGPNRLIVRSPDALNRIVWAPGELGIGRAFVSGDIDFGGDVFELIAALRPAGVHLRTDWRAIPPAIDAARRTGALRRPLPPPPEEIRPRGLRHSKRRDAQAVRHHYDVGNDFYRLVLGESMTYSCARFVDTESLAEAQVAKHDLIARKLGLPDRSGMRLLDVGCGWGSMALHAAERYGAEVVGITISPTQAELARERARERGLSDHVEIRVQDYRDLEGETFDAISSIGMFEHVGKRRMADYFAVLRRSLAPRGRLLNHAISSVGGTRLASRTFVGRYVFPDGELIDVGEVALAMEDAGLEVRDVESLREHYARTLRHWVANLQDDWDRAVDLVGENRARVWLLYMAASAIGFEDGGNSIHQVLGVLPDDDGGSGMPASRQDWG
jgi:cyclopropane-fatty-acyl-phospholipid synthase